MNNIILEPYSKGALTLKNRLVMAPMTRSRAIDNLPNALMAEYYGQRNGAGLIVSEGTAPTPDALGYPRIPGIYSQQQVEAWKQVTAAVHAGNSKFFMQLMHTGRIGHIDNLAEGAELLGVSDLKAAGQIFTDTKGMQDHSEPVALTSEKIQEVKSGYVTAARNAIEAGCDGIELHAANGYLMEQFLNPNVNNRTDGYGGSMENRAKFTVEVARETAAAIGKDKVGIRISPYSTLGDLQMYPEEEVFETYRYLAQQMNTLGITYIHIGLSPKITQELLAAIRSSFQGTLIICNGLTPASAAEDLEKGMADLVAFGRSYLANPDLDVRIAENAPLNQPDYSTFYTPGAKGYTDYPYLT